MLRQEYTTVIMQFCFQTIDSLSRRLSCESWYTKSIAEASAKLNMQVTQKGHGRGVKHQLLISVYTRQWWSM